MNSITVPRDLNSVTVEEVIKISGQLISEKNRLLDFLVDKMLEPDNVEEMDKANLAGVVKFGNKPCGKNCTICPYIFTKDFIVNRANPANSFKFDKHFTCNSFDKGVVVTLDDGQKVVRKGGIYAIICTKPTCQHRGVVYFGESEDASGRLGTHVSSLKRNSGNIQKVLRHFHSHNDVDDMGEPWPTKHFQVCLVKEVTTGTNDRQEEEKIFYTSFRTRGFAGFNIALKKTPPSSQEPPTKKAKLGHASDKVQYTLSEQLLGTYGGHAKDRSINQWFPIVLALRNQKEAQQNPTVNPGESTTEGIRAFINEYFKPDSVGVDLKPLLDYLGKNLNPDSAIARNPNSSNHTKWFDRNKRTFTKTIYPTTKQPPNTPLKTKNDVWVYFINPASNSEIDELLLTDIRNGDLANALLDPTKLNEIIGDLANDVQGEEIEMEEDSSNIEEEEEDDDMTFGIFDN